MNKIHVFFITFLCITFYIPTINAQNETIPLCTGKTVVYYGNGIRSEKIDRVNSLKRLIKVIKDSVPQKEYNRLEFRIADNPTGGFVLDLFESIKQNLQLDISRFYRILSGLEPMPDWFQDAYELIAIAVDKTTLLTNGTLQDQLEDYKDDLNNGHNVLIVPHSQGNFFANQVYPHIPSKFIDRFKIVSVANPDRKVEGNGFHTTLTEDWVINILRPFTGALFANRSNGHNFDPLGHSFTEAYMSNLTASKAKIVPDIITTLHSFPPCPDFIGVSGLDLVNISITNNGNTYDIDIQPTGVKIDANGLFKQPIQSLSFQPFNKLLVGIAILYRIFPEVSPNFPYSAAGVQEIDLKNGGVTDFYLIESGHSLDHAIARSLAVNSTGHVVISSRQGGFLINFKIGQPFREGAEFINHAYTDAGRISALAFHPNGILYGWSETHGLVTIDHNFNGYINFPTNIVTVIGFNVLPPEITRSNPIESIEFLQDGTLIGVQPYGGFYKIDTQNGDVIRIGDSGSVSAIARPIQ